MIRRTARQPGRVLLGLFGLITLFGLFGLIIASGLAHAAPTRLFVTEYQYNSPKIKGMDLDGANPQELFSIPASEWLPVGCDYDDTTGKIYWTHGGSPGTIRRANLDGTQMELLVTGLKYPRGIAIDPLHGKIYWVQAPAAGNAIGLLKRANLDGTGIETVYAENPYDPTYSFVSKPTVDPTNGYVYFSAGGAIRRLRLDGTGALQTVVRGVTTVAAIALDVGAGRIYFADANTNSDYIGRANLDDSGFTLLYDNTPAVFGTSGLFDMKLDLEGGKLYWTDELAKTVRKCDLDGSGMETIYTSPTSLAPTGLTLNTDPLPPVQDCNDNGIRDLDDISNGTSADCNVNGIPDECEIDACVPVVYTIDNGSDPSGHRTLSGEPVNGFEVFQAFDLVSPTAITQLGLDGWTATYHPTGFNATIFPDDGTGTFPDETHPIASRTMQYRFSSNTIVWVYGEIAASLTPGRWWVRLTANDPTYTAAACYGLSGPPSFSRKLGNGQIYPSSRSIALRVRGLDPAAIQDPAETALDVRVCPPEPNPASDEVRIRVEAVDGSSATCAILDAAGRRIRTLEASSSDRMARGIVWDGRAADGRRAGVGAYFALITVRDPLGSTSTFRAGPLLLLR